MAPKFSDTVEGPLPTNPTDLIRAAAGVGALLVVSWLVIWPIDFAWLACAGDIEAGGRFAYRMELLFGIFPATVATMTLAVGLAVLVTRHRHTAVRAATAGIAIAAVAMLVFALAIPHPRYDPADLTDFESQARCGPGGMPVGWPVWLPS